MSFKRTQLQNGIGITFVPSTKFKSNRIDIRFVTPLSEETASERALIFPVIFRATEKYPSTREVRLATENVYDLDVYCGSGKRGDAQIISVGISFLSNKYSIDGSDILCDSLDILRQFLLCPKTENGAFIEKYVDSEKQRMIDSELARINNKGVYARCRCESEMCAGEPYAISENGTVEQIAAVTPSALYESYKELLAHSMIEISAVGDMDEEKTIGFFNDVFSSVDRGEIFSADTVSMHKAREAEQRIYERQNVTQGKLALGFSTGICENDDMAYILPVFSAVFGAGTTSKLFMNVREKLSLCYYCSSSINSSKGIMTVNSGILFENEKKAVDEILVQLAAVQNGEISDFELDSAKKGIIDDLRATEDSKGSLSSFAFNTAISKNPKTIDEKIKEIESITKEQVSLVAKGVKLDTYYFLCGKEN